MPSSAQEVRRRLQSTPTKFRTESDVPSRKRARLAASDDSPVSSTCKGSLKQHAEESSASILAVSFYGLKKNKTVKENVPSAVDKNKSDKSKSDASRPFAKYVTESDKSVHKKSNLDKLMLEKIALSPVKQAFLQTCSLAEFKKVYRNEFIALEEEVKRANVRVTRQSSQILNKTSKNLPEDSTDEEDSREQDLNSKTRTKPSSKTAVGSCDMQPLNGNSILTPKRNQQRMMIKGKRNAGRKKAGISNDNADHVINDKFNSPVLDREIGSHTGEEKHGIDQQSETKKSTPSSTERKFFKTRSPLENTKKGVAILTKGFGLKFVPKQPKTVGKKNSGQKRQHESLSPRTAHTTLVRNVSTSRTSNRKQNINSLEPVSPVSGFLFAPGFLSPEKVTQENSEADQPEDDDNVCFSLNRSNCSTYSSASQNHTAAEVIDTQSVKEIASIHLTENFSHRVEQQIDLFVEKNSTGTHVNENDTSQLWKDGQTSESSHKLFPIFERRNDQPALSNKKRSPVNDTSPVSISSKLPKDSSNSQMIIDAGQKKFGVTQCSVCSMVYCHADSVDEEAHVKFHRQHLEVLKFAGWKKERVVQEYPEDLGRVILVMPDDPKYVRKKVEEVYQLMGRELGFPDTASTPVHPYHKVFLYVADKQITGCCVAEPVQEGYRIIPGDLDNSEESGQRPWCCSSVSEPVCVGISRLWVSAASRKLGVATKLVDCVRQWFNYGSLIPKHKIAFSDPTPDGRRFAQKYTGTPMFLVYKYNYG